MIRFVSILLKHLIWSNYPQKGLESHEGGLKLRMNCAQGACKVIDYLDTSTVTNPLQVSICLGFMSINLYSTRELICTFLQNKPLFNQSACTFHGALCQLNSGFRTPVTLITHVACFFEIFIWIVLITNFHRSI